MRTTVPAAAMAMTPPIIGWEEHPQSHQQVVIAARTGLDHRNTSGRMRHEHVEQSVTLVAYERGAVSGEVEHDLVGAGDVRPDLGVHSHHADGSCGIAVALTTAIPRLREGIPAGASGGAKGGGRRYRPGVATGTEDEALQRRRKAARAACQRTLFGHGEVKPADQLARLAHAEVGDVADRYGEGGVLAELETEVATLLGTEAAAFMPSGIMAQQCVLRTWADRRSAPRVAVHALSHLVVHELNALPALHGLTLEHLTDESRQPTPADLAAIPGHLGAATLELPLRDGGHVLPTWDELSAFAKACRDRDLPLHLDGARLWESTPYLGHSLTEVVDLADSVYVSFYKGLGGLAGAAVAGTDDVIAEARRWQRRHGGNLFTLLPYAVSARVGLRRHLPRMAEYHDVAVALARALEEAGIRCTPDPPHTNAFQMYAPAVHDEINQRLLVHLETTHEAISSYWQPADAPGWSVTEFTVGAATCETGAAEVAARLSALVLGTEGP